MVNQKLSVNFEVEKNGRVFVFAVPANTPFADCYDVLFDFIASIKEMERQSQQKPEEPAESPADLPDVQ